MRVAGLGQPLADGLNALVALVGDVGDFSRGRFQVADPPLGVPGRGLQVALGRGVVADQDALDQLVLGGLDLDDRRGEVLVGRRSNLGCGVAARRTRPLSRQLGRMIA